MNLSCVRFKVFSNSLKFFFKMPLQDSIKRIRHVIQQQLIAKFLTKTGGSGNPHSGVIDRCEDNPSSRLFTVPYFSVGFSRLVRFDQTPAILVYNGEGNLRRVSKLPRGVVLAPPSPLDVLTRAPIGSSDTLPRLRSPLQTKIAGVRPKCTSLENPTEN